MRTLAALLLAASAAFAQNVAVTLKGRVVDPAGAVMPGAEIVLVQVETGTIQKVTTNPEGLFVYPTVAPGAYRLEVTAPGFKQYRQDNLELTSSEIRDLGQIALAVGEARESVTVVDTATPLNLGSGEKSGLVSGEQLNELALKGRDFMSLVALIPGIVDTNESRETTSNTSIDGIYINGGRNESKNFTVDGIGTMDTGGQNSVHYQPNMDSIAEVRVLTSNFQAEYGRSAGGVISVVTKGGGREFHGTGWATFRNESLNANSFFNNKTAIPRQAYRYLIGGYSLGGPIFIPGRLNTSRSKLFFFVSQEYTKRKVDAGAVYANMPTALERAGDFSRSLDTNGRLITITDPLAKMSFPGNIVPKDRFNSLGQSILNFFPMPNYVDSDPAQVYRRNYKAAASGDHPRRNDMVRVDTYPLSKVNGYFRWIRDYDDQELPFSGFTNFLYSSWMHPNPGHGFAGHVTYTARPSLVNELSVGRSLTRWEWRAKEPEKARRSVIGDIPQWYKNVPTTKDPADLEDSLQLPNISFGGTPVNPPAIAPNNKQHININGTWDFTDNLMWVKGSHTIKTGVFVNLVTKTQVQSLSWNGVLNFGVDTNNPYNTRNGFSNALLGYFNTYTESTLGGHFDGRDSAVEFFVQDNWRASRRLTLDYGIRFYHMKPQTDDRFSVSAFHPDLYNRANAPVLYRPGFDAKGNRVAVNPLTGQTAYPALIGMFVPGSGDTANGMAVAGKAGFPGGVIEPRLLSPGPRIGFAYDWGGRGRTVIRGGAGIFLNRSRQTVFTNTINNPPVAYTPISYYGNLDTLTQSAGATGPSNVAFMFPDPNAHGASVTNYSLGIQRMLPAKTVLDVSYVGNFSRHLWQARNLNPIPMFARFDTANEDPTQKGKPLPDNFFRRYPGYGDLTSNEFAASANYNSLQTQVQRRMSKGLRFGAAYTWAKALGVANAYNSQVSSYFSPRERNYGPLGFDRTHTLTFNYTYNVPKLGKALGSGVLGVVTDNWTLSGVTTFVSGPPFTPGFSTAANSDVTGSSEGAVVTVIGNPRLDKSQKTFERNFNVDAFAATPKGSFGNAGVNILRKPGINNWDISLSKNFNVGLGEKRPLMFRAESYNSFNHTQFSNLDTTARFDAQGKQTSLSFGSFSAARPGRVISFALRYRF